MEKNEEYKDSFSIGTNSTGGSTKVYFDLNNLEECKSKIKNFFDLLDFIKKEKEKSIVSNRIPITP